MTLSRDVSQLQRQGVSAASRRRSPLRPSGTMIVVVIVTILLAGVLVALRGRPTSRSSPSQRLVSPEDRRSTPHAEGSNPTDAEPDDLNKPQSPTDLTKPSLRFVLRRTMREFGSDQCTDLAAALTYYAVLSIFPALVVVISLLGVFGQGRRTSDALLGIIGDVAPGGTVDTLRGPIEQLINAPSAGTALVIGILGALWSASGYIGAFGRAMNRMYEIDEGRPVWKLRPQQLLLTAVGLVIVATVAFLLGVSGPLAEAIGGHLGLGSVALTVWNIGRWPVVLALATLGVAVLYYAGPNVKQPTFRWVSVGAVIAILTWVAASIGFGLYVANFSSYNKTYGALAGVIVFLLWLWITNLALLFGAEVNSELERGRQLQGGMAAETELQLPPRDSTIADKNRAKDDEDVERGRLLRQTRGDAG